MNRRSFLRLIGLGAVAATLPKSPEPPPLTIVDKRPIYEFRSLVKHVAVTRSPGIHDLEPFDFPEDAVFVQTRRYDPAAG